MRPDQFHPAMRIAQRKIINRRSRIYFGRLEDREDFRQEVSLVALERWEAKGRPMWGDGPDFDSAEMLSLTAKKRWLKKQMGYGDSRRGDILSIGDAYDYFDQFPAKPLGFFLDRKPLPNPKDAIGKRQYKFVTQNGITLSLTYDELEEFTGFNRSSIGRLRRLSRPLKAYLFHGRLYPGIKHIQAKHSITEAAARWNSSIAIFEWANIEEAE